MEIKCENYSVIYDSSTATINCEGTLRLYGSEGYADILELFDKILEQKPETITLNLKGLQFLNSSGINMLSKFVIKVRNQNISRLIVHGTEQYPWQGKSLKNLQRLMPSLKLEFL